MNYSAINIQGNIFTSEILEKIRQEDTRFQAAKDFNLNQGDSVRDEINLAWTLAISHWNAFKQKRENLTNTDTGTTETRKYWALPLLQILGYDVSASNAELVNEKSYAVSHRAANKDGFPIHIVGVQQSLDKKADIGGARLSPHALIQEYLNNTEHLYGFTTNGALLRVLRDATRLSRLSYIEFNLEQMMEEGLYVEFALLYRILHSSRIATKKDENAESILEWYHQEALSSGSRIRERLSAAVEQSILLLAEGLLQNQYNEVLRQSVDENRLDAKTYYLQVLRTVYRILFLLVIEERKLIYPEKREEELNHKRDIYYKFYSIQRLTYLVEKQVYVDPKKTDLWQSLLTTFQLFESSEFGNKLGISALGSGLFAPTALGTINNLKLSNEILLKVLRYLVTFENENKQLVRVNYADLDVEEFGSVYEGLLEYDPAITNHHFNFIKGDARSSSGSHYTPEELVKPLIVHSLDYLIADKLKETNPEAGLLSLSICDVACGSGHILLSAARRVGFELAKYRSKEDQPTPSVLRIAIRDVIKNCIYGVDLNPLAVELCKVALWLEAHEPGQPMNFLDHHIKCGNAIVGLAHFEELENGIASEAFKTLPEDNKEIAAAYKKRNDLERNSKGQLTTYNVEQADDSLRGLQKEFQDFTRLPENTPEQIANKEAAYKALTNGKKWFRLKQLADIQVAQFFIPKIELNKEKLTTQSQYMNYLKSGAQIMDRGAAIDISNKKHFFHWFLEFPQVFQNGGFDCILGNPPYLGGSKISSKFNYNLSNFLNAYFPESSGLADLVTFFIKRIYSIIQNKKYFSIITTDTVSQGITRESSLDYIILNGDIVFAVKSIKWPGVANISISILSFFKGNFVEKKVLNNNKVDFIDSFLNSSNNEKLPLELISNKNLIFSGSKLYGEGFVLNESEYLYYTKNIKNKEVIKPYLVGDDIVNTFDFSTNRWVIDVNHLEIEEIEQFYPLLFKHIVEKIKTEREKIKENNTAKKYYWKFTGQRKELYEAIDQNNKIIAFAKVTKYIIPVFLKNKYIYSDKIIALVSESNLTFGIIQSSIFSEWVRKYSTKIGSQGAGIQFSISGCFSNFPIIKISNPKLDEVSSNFNLARTKLQKQLKIGTTVLFNFFHSKGIQINTFQKNKHLSLLQKQLDKTEGLVFLEEVLLGFDELRILFIQLDNVILEAYGWQDIALRHDFYEVEYLPENDRVRYTIHPEARKEILKRLLELNHKIHAEEVAAGLWDKKKPAKKEKVVIKKAITKEQKEINQVSLFDIENNIGMKEFSLNEGIYSILDAANIIKQPVDKVRRWFKKLSEVDYEGLDGSAKTDIENRRISFHGLIELVVIGTLLDNGLKIKDVIIARKNLKEITQKEYPFATNNVRDNLKKSGSSIIFRTPHGDVTLDGTSQFNLDFIYMFFDGIIFENDIAVRIIPLKGNGEIIIDPKLASGKPSFIKHHDLEVEMILGFYEDESSIDDLMGNYSLTKEEIEAALNYSS